MGPGCGANREPDPSQDAQPRLGLRPVVLCGSCLVARTTLGALATREIDTAADMAIHCGMATTTIKSTYSLDVESVRVLEALAQRWNVSKSEVLRRAIRIAATGGKPGEGASLDTLDRLQTSLRERNVDVSQWARDQKAARREAGRWMPLKSE